MGRFWIGFWGAILFSHFTYAGNGAIPNDLSPERVAARAFYNEESFRWARGRNLPPVEPPPILLEQSEGEQDLLDVGPSQPVSDETLNELGQVLWTVFYRF